MSNKYKQIQTEWFRSKAICLEDMALLLNRKKYKKYSLKKLFIDKQAKEPSIANGKYVYKCTAFLEK